MAINSNYVLQKYIARATLAGMILLSLTGCRTSTSVDIEHPDFTRKPENVAIEAEGRRLSPPSPSSHTSASSPSSPSSLDRKMAVREPKQAIDNSSKIVPSNLPLRREPGKTEIVNLYQPDLECKKLMPEPVAVESDRSMDEAVSKVLQARNTADFTVAGYRISIDKNRVATVDLRLNPDSRRQFVSLSMCEQFALFGSLRETLTNHPDWQIKSVKFSDRGKLIQL